MDPPAVVIDAGTYEVRAGLAGDDAPRYRAPNCTARPKQQLQVLVADEIYTIKNHAQLGVLGRWSGALVRAGAQRDVFGGLLEVQCTPEIRIVVTECAVNLRPRGGLRRDFIRDFPGRMRLPAAVCAAAKSRKFSRTGNGTSRRSTAASPPRSACRTTTTCFDLRCGPQRVDPRQLRLEGADTLLSDPTLEAISDGLPTRLDFLPPDGGFDEAATIDKLKRTCVRGPD